jgi:hypothetical protein
MYERKMLKLLRMIKFWQNWFKSEELKTLHYETYKLIDGFGGLVVSMLASGSNPAEAVGFLTSVKNPQHAFLRRGSKRICPMSQLCGM